jgi:DNA end-binding protein Ku
MASRAIWEGTISFGLVQIPVGLHSAESRDDLDFTLLDRRDLAPVGYQRYNRDTDEPVSWDDIVKGYEYEEGQYVVLEKEDFKRANVRSTQTVDIVHFADPGAVDPMYFEKPYYLLPGKRGEKPYVLLREVLRRSGKIGIATVVIRTREHVAELMVRGPALVLELLRFDHELVKPGELDLPAEGVKAAKISPAELKMAERLVEDMVDEFMPAQFKDTYRDDLLAFIHRKIKEGDTAEIEAPVPEPEPSNVVDIMSLLRRSLGQRGRGEDAPRRAAKGAAKKAPRRAKAGAAKKAAKRGTKTAAKKATKRGTKTAAKTAARKRGTARKAA